MVLNPMLLSNVVFGPKLLAAGVPKSNMHIAYELDEMRNLLWDLATKKPLWEFVISKSSLHGVAPDSPIAKDGLTHTLLVRSVTIKDSGEELGSFAVNYHGGTKKIFVTNERIAKERTGRNGGKMVTSDAKRAYREIIKNFYAKNPLELTVSAVSLISSSLTDMIRSLNHACYIANNDLESVAAAAIRRSPELIAVFSDSDRASLTSAFETWKDNNDKQHEATNTVRVVNDMYKSLTEQISAPSNAAVVVSQGSTYVLTYKGQTCTIPSEDLPSELRGPLGMLKLSDAMKVVEGVGFRVDDKIFFVFAQESNDGSAD